jgi:cation-transporting ATPase E
MTHDHDNQGLTAAEVSDRIAAGLVNRSRPSVLAEYRDILRRNLFTLFNALVIPASIALFSVNEGRSAIAVSGMALTTTLLGLIQEIRAHRLLQKLAVLRLSRVRVRRDGAEQDIEPEEVVQGDVVLLRSGEPVPADGPLLTSHFLEVDESLLTGEADPVPRGPGETVLSGSFCVAGEGAFRAEKVGSDAFAQQLALQARSYRHVLIPFQRTLDGLLNSLTVIALLLCLLYLGLMFAHGYSRAELYLMIAATVTSMVPQGLVLTTSLAFTLAAVRLSLRGAIVQQLSAVESMAAVNVLCLDKTGTLTTNRLRLDHVVPLADALTPDEVQERLRFFACNSLDQENKTIAALRAELGESKSAGDWTVVSGIPFHSQRRFSALLIRARDRTRLLVLGAIEALQERLGEPARQRALERWHAELPAGARLLLFAQGDLGPDVIEKDPQTLLARSNLEPLALVALRDELRPDARDTLLALLQEGIRPRVLSGDTPQTVARVCQSLPIPTEAIASGQELADSPRPEELIERTSVFGRLAPLQKVQIIATLQQRGDHVAMIGDGVNDVLAIKKADLGVAMGQGSQAAQVVAGIVLRNNRFELLPAALAEGRRVIAALIQVARLFLLKNVSMLFLFLGALLLLRLPFPILPQQVTLLNALTIGGPTLLILATRSQSAALPRGRNIRSIATFVLTRGPLLGVFELVLLWISANLRGDEPARQRTLLLTSLIVHGLAVVLHLAWGKGTGPGLQRALLLSWSALALVIYVLVLGWRPMAYFFDLQMPDVAEWALASATALASLTFATLAERLVTRALALRADGTLHGHS